MLDGTQEAEQKAKMMLSWDVSNGVSHTQAFPLAFAADLRETLLPSCPENSPAAPAYCCLLSSYCWISPSIFGGCCWLSFVSSCL